MRLQKRLQTIKNKARPFTEDKNRRMEDNVLTVLKQHRESLLKQSSNDPDVSTGAEQNAEASLKERRELPLLKQFSPTSSMATVVGTVPAKHCGHQTNRKKSV